MTLTTCLLRFCLAVMPVVPAAPEAAARPVAVAPSAASYVGFWLLEDQDAVVEISRQGDTYQGRFVAFRKQAADAKKKALIGTYLLKDLKPDGDELSGKVIDPKSGKDYKVTLAMTGPKTLEMRVKAMGMTAHRESWTRQATAN